MIWSALRPYVDGGVAATGALGDPAPAQDHAGRRHRLVRGSTGVARRRCGAPRRRDRRRVLAFHRRARVARMAEPLRRQDPTPPLQAARTDREQLLPAALRLAGPVFSINGLAIAAAV